MPSHTCSMPPDHRLVGDPVDTLTGAIFDRVIDFRLTGPLDLWWYRHYDSSHNENRFALGWGHTHEFDRILRIEGEQLLYELPVGRVFAFPRLKSDGAEKALSGFVLHRLTALRYEVFQNGEPTMEFEFHDPQQPA